ncbi:PQ-loop-domain-containing protein [Armillaria solidipes]|uniref:PQ-loop-domain-containing protein n=1 Tax=Armillaria solidipes TaxID=1076256 RepID=A0A2H3C8S4_9AGAR|nr:PQ-loop-domain-containing protein [Armillaria solidipes]
MLVNSAAENALGTLGAVCWTIQLLPQIWKTWREKSTEGLSPWLVLIWGLTSIFLGVYAIVQRLSIALIVQPQLFGTLSLISWGQCQYYDNHWSIKRSVLAVVSIVCLIGGLQAGMVFAVRPSYEHGNHRGVDFFGVFASVMLSAGLLPQFYEIYKHKEVIGISKLFMLVDLLGGVFSLLSLVFRDTFDVLAGVAYSLVVVLDGLVIILAMILNPLARRRRRRAASEEEALDTPTTTSTLEKPDADPSPSEKVPV